jgi:hypothetical protein
MGEWLMPDAYVSLSDVLGSPAFGVPREHRLALAMALRDTGFLVSSPYYVPDADELFDLYRQLSEVDYCGRGRIKRSWLRWVMCGETQIALQRKYGQTRTVHTPELSAFLSAGGDLTDTITDQVHLVITTRAAASLPAAIDAGRLFDMPIRRDPAARRPLWELVPKGERA